MKRWAYSLAEISRALGGDGRSTGRCPAHDDRSPSLSIGIGREAQPLAHCHAGCSPNDVFAELERRRLIVRDGDGRGAGIQRHDPVPTAELEPASAEPHQAKKRAAGIWSQTRPITADDTVGRYLAARRCALPPPGADLRWLPANPPKYPLVTMVARVSDFEDAGRGLSLHFTAVSEDGTRGERRLMAGLPSKGVVRLLDDADAHGGLFVAEGIETALSGPQPVFACVSAGNLAVLPVLAGFECLTIHVDEDPAGRSAAEKCAARWHAAGVEVRLVEAGGARGP